ncbi:type II toxin-antitoxin system Phd/YefM family antitoxin [Coraliomargarita akajimensis]|uniref:Antitoxin n=1 Tax=Coraliomargarita akajimensis (strain DSM 45221 / IAM 15411 / JCM 23193 / KCTC 12865 / 04OKA010-24) TaxID=583355 RepID=D5EPU9_CORAD|nr:type II toxin-antitoxin system Phd/YefM family antitoxin [Coraliomargarita akajimensis]ADE55682.1 prevent-host-death family protein [Coraliomargarita akajimensis DSM 45221]
MKRWKISEAKARLSEVVSSCVEEPQVLYNREKPVAALIDMEEYEQFLEYKKSQRKKTMAEWLEELDEIKKQEPGDFELPPRTSRPIPYLDEWIDE